MELHALMDDVLEVRRRTSDPLEPARAPRIGAVRRLGDGDRLVAALLEQVHEPQAVLGHDHAVGVERHHVVAVGHDEIGGGVVRRQQEPATGIRDVAVAGSHQADIAVQVHRLVRLARQRHIVFALERCELGAERPRQPAVEMSDAAGRQSCRVICTGAAQRGRGHAEVGGKLSEHVRGEEALVVVGDLVPGGEVVHPCSRPLVVAGERRHLSRVRAAVGVQHRLPERERGVETGTRPRQQVLHHAWHFARLAQKPVRLGITWVGRVVEQKHDADVRIFLQRRRQQRHLDHARLLLVGGNERGQRWAAAREELIELRPWDAPVMAASVVEAEPGNQVGQGRGREQRDDDQERNRLRDAGATRSGPEQLARHDRDHQREPRACGDDHRRPADREREVAGRPRHRRHRVHLAVGTPLPPARVSLH